MTPGPGSPEPNTADKAARARDARIRFRLLNALHAQRSNEHGGWCTGRFLIDVVCGYLPDQEQPRDDDHALALLRDLVNKNFAGEEDNREDKWQPFGLDYLTFKVTANGSSFVNRSLPADADIDDGRIVKS